MDMNGLKESILRVLGNKGAMSISVLKNFASNRTTKEEFLPAIVSKAWGGDNGCSNLHVFNGHSGEIEFKTSVLFSGFHTAGTWHWPEKEAQR